MKPIPGSVVEPRRNVLSVLWMSVVGALASLKILSFPVPAMAQETNAAGAAAAKPTPPPPYDSELEMTSLVGRLCLDKDFRDAFFGLGITADEAINKTQMVRKQEVRDALKAILQAPRHSPNPVEAACAEVGKQIITIVTPLKLPCKPWPC